ncbi:putative integral membrane protein [Dongia mobilis]|uniref:Putative integral membrane protein n=1 Tax=Dongia mobilis TaxID=578943 RepID=A0A4R6WME0_9PROT|nr:LapA family protein [Dongia mobilis]TDQ82142.1 putative integral membrane protein [Dongia mobilis]
MSRLVWIVTAPIAILVVLFAVMNRAEVTLSLWPFPWEITAPLFLFTLGAIVFGFLFGSLVTWISGGRARQKLRLAQRELAEAQGALQRAEAARQPASRSTTQGPTQGTPPATMLPPAA